MCQDLKEKYFVGGFGFFFVFYYKQCVPHGAPALPYCDGSEIPLQCQMVIQGKELGRNLVKSEDSLLSKF